MYDTGISIIRLVSHRALLQLGYISHHIITIYLLNNATSIFYMKTYFEFECTNLFLFLGFYLAQKDSKNVMWCKWAHTTAFIYLRIIRGYHTLTYVCSKNYFYYNYKMCLVGIILYMLCWIGLCSLVISKSPYGENVVVLRKDSYNGFFPSFARSFR